MIAVGAWPARPSGCMLAGRVASVEWLGRKRALACPGPSGPKEGPLSFTLASSSLLSLSSRFLARASGSRSWVSDVVALAEVFFDAGFALW